MTGASCFVQPRLALALLLAACAALGGPGAPPPHARPPPRASASEPVAAPEPPPAPKPAPAAVAKAERPKSTKKRAAKPTPAPAPEVRTNVAARTPEPRRPQQDGASTSLGATESEPVPFEPSGMTRPQRVSGREPQLTPEARAERVHGTALVRCVVTREGGVKGCKLLNDLPYMEKELLEAVSSWRVTPVTAQGKPLNVEYTFVVRIPSS